MSTDWLIELRDDSIDLLLQVGDSHLKIVEVSSVTVVNYNSYRQLFIYLLERDFRIEIVEANEPESRKTVFKRHIGYKDYCIYSAYERLIGQFNEFINKVDPAVEKYFLDLYNSNSSIPQKDARIEVVGEVVVELFDPYEENLGYLFLCNDDLLIFVSYFGVHQVIQLKKEYYSVEFATNIGNLWCELGPFIGGLFMGPYNFYLLTEDQAKKFDFFAENYNSIQRRKNANMLSIIDTDMMSGLEFEEFVAWLFKRMGYKTEVTVSIGDQGVDVIAERDGKKVGIQAKCYSNYVSNDAIQQIAAGMRHYNLDKGMVVTNSYFTKSAIRLAQSNSIILWDRDVLKEKIEQIDLA